MNIAGLQALLGSELVSIALEDRLAVGQDASTLRGDCLAVVWPEHAEQVRAVMEWALEEKVDLVPRGAGTGLCGGATPHSSIVVDFSRMRSIGAVDAEARCIQVDAGTVLGTLNRQLQPYGLFFPVIPGSHRAASIGGMLATNAAGLRAVRYGKMQNWVQKITLVDGRGQIHHFTGEQLDQAVGREGVTGFILQATLKLAPIPASCSLSLRAFSSDHEILVERERLLQAERLSAMEYLNRHAAALVGWEPRPHLIVEWESSAGEILAPARFAELWQARDGLYPRLAQSGYPVIEDPQIEGQTGLAALLEWLDAQGIPAFGHLGMGIVHPCFQPGDPRLEELYLLTAEQGGRVSGEHGIGLKKKSWVSAVYRDELRRLKAEFDPNNVLNRGKLC
jgi:glycolate oxidase